MPYFTKPNCDDFASTSFSSPNDLYTITVHCFKYRQLTFLMLSTHFLFFWFFSSVSEFINFKFAIILSMLSCWCTFCSNATSQTSCSKYNGSDPLYSLIYKKFELIKQKRIPRLPNNVSQVLYLFHKNSLNSNLNG